ncbi:MAG: methyltransferase domain-containing protein [Rhodobacteraceae bacterium]|nr:methyltransferase domain-containing protein [Paracoccaceae bacterium]
MQGASVPDTAALTQAGRKLWSSGDFNVIARQTMMIAEDLVRIADPRPGARVLDIACGSGNIALIAARRYCAVAGIDIAANLIDAARRRAAAEGSEIDFRTGDAQDLPFDAGAFDMVTSAFGIMFAPDQRRAATEALRVTRPGGRLVLANWMPEGFGRDFFGAHARHAPPPEGAPSPLVWGSEAGITALLGDGAGDFTFQRGTGYAFFRSVDHALDVFAAYFGPTIRALQVVGADGADALRADLGRVIAAHNRADDGTVRMQTDYLLTIATRA